MKRIAVLYMVLVLGGGVFAQNEIDLQGTVKDSKGSAVAEALVMLVSDTTLRDTTDANGAFIISKNIVMLRRALTDISVNPIGSIGIKGNKLVFSIGSSAENGAVAIFNPNGKRCGSIPLGKMEQGLQTCMLPELAPGFYVMDISVDQVTLTMKLVNTGSEIILNEHTSSGSSTSQVIRNASAQAIDTLVVKKEGFKTVKVAIDSYKKSDIAIVTDVAVTSDNKFNLFATVLGKTEEEIDAKLDKGFQQLFHGSGDQPIYYESGGGAYIHDVNNNDVRSEGQSYGMMICVQYDKPDEFEKIWSWSKRVMGFPNFNWRATTGGSANGGGSAPDGEEYFATALIFAGKRWNKSNYTQEGKQVCGATKQFFNGNLCQFVAGSGFIDVSYVLPAFYEVWAKVDAGNAGFWQSCASTGRSFFHKVCNAQTMLTPKCATTGGSATDVTYFEADSWRVVANIMTDLRFFGVDEWQKNTYAPTYAKFWSVQQKKDPMPDELDVGGNVRVSHSPPAKALIAYNAMVGYAIPAEDAKLFVQMLWDMEIPKGQYRYYDGCIYLLALMHCSGRFQLYY